MYRFLVSLLLYAHSVTRLRRSLHQLKFGVFFTKALNTNNNKIYDDDDDDDDHEETGNICQ